MHVVQINSKFFFCFLFQDSLPFYIGFNAFFYFINRSFESSFIFIAVVFSSFIFIFIFTKNKLLHCFAQFILLPLCLKQVSNVISYSLSILLLRQSFSSIVLSQHFSLPPYLYFCVCSPFFYSSPIIFFPFLLSSLHCSIFFLFPCAHFFIHLFISFLYLPLVFLFSLSLNLFSSIFSPFL